MCRLCLESLLIENCVKIGKSRLLESFTLVMWIFVWFGLDGGHETCVVLLASPSGNMKTERILAISGHIKLSVEGARS